MNVRRFLPCAALALSLISWPACTASVEQILLSPGVHSGISFGSYPAVATASEIVRRFLSPLAAEAVRRNLQASHTALRQELFDSRSEQFLVYVPNNRPAAGYGLLVFVPPWPQAQLPPGWARVLDKYGIIFASPLRAGNEQNVLERRLPLALAALSGIEARFQIDPAKRLIGGFSGGSRVAMQIALAYPDWFSGALLNAGSDPIGQNGIHLPAQDLMLAFQTHTRLAYVTGELDEASLSLDYASIDSMRHWCVGNVNVRNERGVGHEPASPQALDWAIQTLFGDARGDSSQLAACRAARETDVQGALAAVSGAISSGHAADVQRMLRELDGKYGGLAAPQSVKLADRCSCAMLNPVTGSALR